MRQAVWIVAGVVLGLAPAPAQSRLPEVEIAPEIRALLAIKAKMKRSLAEVPDYVCSETVNRIRVNERKSRKVHTVPADFSDTVQVEVAVVEGSEVYSWPGEEFRAVPLAEMVGFGLMATGSFASLARSVFVNGQGVIRYAGGEELGGVPALRYDYRVSLFRSGYHVQTPRGESKAAYEGSFWAAADDSRLLRLTRRAVDMPPQLGLSAVTTQIDYADVSIDGAGFTLPRRAVDELRYADGALSRNEVAFERCRKYGAEATLSFDVAEEPPAVEPRRESAALDVPVGAELHVELITEVRSETAKVGDAVRARLRREVELGGRTALDKGVLALGRVRRIQRLGREAAPYFAVALEFTELQTAESSAAVRTTLVDLPGAENASRSLDAAPEVRTSRRGYGWGPLTGEVETTVSEWDVDHGVEGLDTFYVKGQSFRLREGFRMVLRVVDGGRD